MSPLPGAFYSLIILKKKLKESLKVLISSLLITSRFLLIKTGQKNVSRETFLISIASTCKHKKERLKQRPSH